MQFSIIDPVDNSPSFLIDAVLFHTSNIAVSNERIIKPYADCGHKPYALLLISSPTTVRPFDRFDIDIELVAQQHLATDSCPHSPNVCLLSVFALSRTTNYSAAHLHVTSQIDYRLRLRRRRRQCCCCCCRIAVAVCFIQFCFGRILFRYPCDLCT